MATKIFVLDTNVILHDYKAIMNFEENDIVIPITVLEELDKFKKGNDQINFNAREFMRKLDKMVGESLFEEGVRIGEGKGLLFISTGKDFSEEMEISFFEKTADHRILAVADHYRRKYPDRKVVLVTQDINFRMKAKSLKIEAQDYRTGKVRDIEIIKKEIITIENCDDNLINDVYKDANGGEVEKYNINEKLSPNQFVILKGEKSSALACYNKSSKRLRKVGKVPAYGIKPRNSEQAFALSALLNEDIRLVTLTGKAGTGKTLLALAAALKQRQLYSQIFLSRPIVPLANRDMGFLPGDAKEKIAPYMQPLFDNLSVIKNQFNNNSADVKRIEDMQKNEQLLITPLAYIRGRSLSDVYFIVDEAQNLTPHEIKTIITRAGENTKMIFTGDIHQIDSPYLDIKSNGLSYLTDKMKGQEIFAHVNLLRGERSKLADLASDLL